MKMESFQHQQATSLFSHMLDQHLEDIAKVNFVNLAAFAVSISEFSEVVKLLVLIASLVYTIAKIVETIKNIRKK